MRVSRKAFASAVAIIGIGIAWWLLAPSSDDFQVLNSVPKSYLGDYVRIYRDVPGDLWPYEETRGVEYLSVEPRRLRIRSWEEKAWRSFDIQRVHQLSSENIYPNALIIFYGRPDKDHIAEYRRQFVPTSTELIDVYEVLTPWVDDTYNRVGTYQSVEHYSDLLAPSHAVE